MSEAEMMARIRELEKENQRLSNIVSGTKRQWSDRRFSIPQEIAEKHGGHIGSEGYVRFPGIDDVDLRNLCAVVRGSCFPKHAKHRRRKGKVYDSDTRVNVREMTDSEYERYVDIVDQVLGVLMKHTYHPAE